MAEWFKAHAWKVCVPSQVPWVRIPLSPPFLKFCEQINIDISIEAMNKIKIGSNRSFGLVFFAVFVIISLWPLTYHGDVRIWSIIVSLIFLLLGILNSKLLTPLNKIWFKFGIALGAIVAPIVMGFIFFLVVTPIGIFMKIIGKDILNKKYNKKMKSYWIKRDTSLGTMKRQF